MSITRSAGPPGSHFETLGVTSGVLSRVLAAALERGGDDCDLYFEHTVTTGVGLTDGRVNLASTQVDLGVGVRVISGDQVGYAYSADLRPEAMLAAARTAAEIASSGPRRSPRTPTAVDVSDRYPVRRPWDEVDVSERVGFVRAWEQAAFAVDPRVRRVQVTLQDSASLVMIVRPDGRLVEDWRPMTTARVQAMAEQDGRRESALYGIAGRAGIEFYTEDRQRNLVREAVSRTLFLLEAEPPPPGEMPVVLAAGPSAILLHEAIGHGMEADFNRKGISIYADRLGKPIANPDVTIVDDGTLLGARGALNVDDEGNATERTVLVENGILKSFMHDEISARHYGVTPTGSGRRQDFRHAPLPRMRSTVMEPGPYSAEEIIQSIDKGLYCVTFANGQVHIGGGDFAFYMKTGWLIENGRLTRPVKDANIIGNGPVALERIDMVGNDLVLDEGGWTCGKDGQSVPVSQGMPTVRVRSLTVGGVS